jgi:hypothetical protein
MPATIAAPDLPRVPDELPIYPTVAPGWDAARVSELGARLDVCGSVVDAGVWYVVRDGVSTLEVYQASHSFRLGRDAFDAEARGACDGQVERERAVAVAERFQRSLGGLQAQAELQSVTELEVLVATREGGIGGQPERRVAGLQVNYRYMLDGLPLVGPGAKAQITVGRDGEVAQAYRFGRAVQRPEPVRAIAPERAFERFANSAMFARLSRAARVHVDSMRLGLLCLPPTEVQSVLVPAYVLRGTISTELLPRDGFLSYVAAVDFESATAKRRRWSPPRPSLLVA